ncbi:hypothetical protein SEA_EDUGATOR_89 [Mycobacterium phage Edugator]|uniref:Uncharacterized protein n=1 Tax=Mycobacterium phage Edugator TaxID=2015843 RepID=A0A222ZM53_9CAUD|nr:hypothetical protein SEA_EDUGATOR_89 [Mycobacterium phage Edugator]
MNATTIDATDITPIDRDTHTGRWMVTRKDGSQLGRCTAAWLAAHIGEGNTGVLWEYSGRTYDGRLLFVRTRFVSRGGKLVGYDADGVCKVVHPADRHVRFLSR